MPVALLSPTETFVYILFFTILLELDNIFTRLRQQIDDQDQRQKEGIEEVQRVYSIFDNRHTSVISMLATVILDDLLQNQIVSDMRKQGNIQPCYNGYAS